MADQPKAGGIPKHVTFEDFDPLMGKTDVTKEDYFQATFHTSDMEDGDAVFKGKATLMEGSASEILGQEEKLETEAEKSKEAATLAQVKAAAL